jgi:hypothetical protein
MWKNDIDLEKLAKIIGVEEANKVAEQMKKEKKWFARTTRKLRRWYYYRISRKGAKRDLVVKSGLIGGEQ